MSVETPSAAGFNARRLRSNLLRHDAAMKTLASLGLGRADVERLGLGMKEPYVTTAGEEVSGVVTYPLQEDGGRIRYGYLALTGVTKHRGDVAAWSPGEARSFSLGEGDVLLVLSGPTAAMQAGVAIERTGRKATAMASSQPDRLPREWADGAFWARWSRVIVSDAIPAAIRRRIAMCASRPIELATVGDFPEFETGLDAAATVWIDGLLSAARPFAAEVATDDAHGLDAPGDYAATPVSLHGGISGDRMYYPFSIERRRAAPDGAMLCSYATVILRSDGAVLEARTLPAPAGTPKHQRVNALTDGTRIETLPEPSRNATWSLPSIRNFIARRADGLDPCSRSAAAVVEDVHTFLAARVWLPEADDLWVATAFVVVTHMFHAFEALPILLFEGMKGTGKTEIASAIASLSFNAVTMGQGSAAALVRIARECGGLVVLDDVEGLSAGGQGFGELSQCLKVGYRASTARKPITLGSGRIETFDFFGPRLMTCTRGVEPVLASRCIRVVTGLGSASGRDVPGVDPAELRDDLHTVGMSRAADVLSLYGSRMLDVTDRSGEIWLPILTVLEALGAMEGLAAVRRALDRRQLNGPSLTGE